ncbi:uncharacterized protein BDR25DRAFT_395696 [Lindgomyces ingoldianus]|uniref:Uncharacterized protein n=1 Tax=Lindgomyces ingoldianus TaxID=673940 RepID=A0ACB6QHU4_9PLEO|nr:uncharacterized protein BDR25DRAFT_395696 [Lindgomyces ingoldianus]KAF2466501.1 hypothetical protein BDR25DRAFT_395696 [Lindgomyces ingoldianus]
MLLPRQHVTHCLHFARSQLGARLTMDSTCLSQFHPVQSDVVADGHVLPGWKSQSNATTQAGIQALFPEPRHAIPLDLRRLSSIPTPSTQEARSAAIFDEQAATLDDKSFLTEAESIASDEQSKFSHATDRLRRRPQPSRNKLKARRMSQPTLLLNAIHGQARTLYSQPQHGKPDLAYASPRVRGARGVLRKSFNRRNQVLDHTIDLEKMPISLYTILARYLRNRTLSPWGKSEHRFTDREVAVLQSQSYSPHNVERWASCLLTRDSYVAARIFQPGNPNPPFFLLTLFLFRKHMTAYALGVVARHIALRLQLGHLDWLSVKLLVIRFLRHARMIWSEAIPWIASIFTTQATRIYDKMGGNGNLSPEIKSDLTHFCNSFLSLLALPTSHHPVLSTHYQQRAQFQVLRFMANRSPALIVTRVGFRAVTRVHLAQRKTPQEQEWAVLKGASWPPWKENRTAMDEEKNFEFGSSRASKIIQRMYEAGYPGDKFEEAAEVYAGWDIDQSPTIQTRTSFPGVSTHYGSSRRFRYFLWAARIRATRTKREAWACFLAYEASKVPARQEVYHAMFEKLVHPELQDAPTSSHHVRALPDTQLDNQLLPGDIKEVFPEPTSPLDLIYISEPIPSYEQLFHRMAGTKIRPTNRFLAFLVETSSDFHMILSLLESNKDQFDGGIQGLLDGSHLDESSLQTLPGYFLAAFVGFLCRFGRYPRNPSVIPALLSREEHEEKLNTDRSYLIDYAYALVLRFPPRYRPVWTAYMQKLSGPWRTHANKQKPLIIYKIMCELVDKMHEVDLELDDEQFRLICTALRHAALCALRGFFSSTDTNFVLSTGPRQIRTLFHTLVSANIETSHFFQPTLTPIPIPPHIPGPAVLHAYVRALGVLCDFEGLYSFSNWAFWNSAEVTVRANAQSGGPVLWRRTLVALRAGLDGAFREGIRNGDKDVAPEDLCELVRTQVQGEEVEGYIGGKRKGGL